MKLIKKILLTIFILIVAAGIGLGAAFSYIENANWGFAQTISLEEQQLRLQVIAEADSWLGTAEGSEKHAKLLDIYNTHQPLAEDYVVKIEDNWCAAFASAIAISCDITDIVPTECGCERQVRLWQEMGRWEENDNYVPLPGDYIYYAWSENFNLNDCKAWSNHVGIVIGTAGPFIKVIEGNKADSVSYRVIVQGHYQIRGFGLPDYQSKTQ